MVFEGGGRNAWRGGIFAGSHATLEIRLEDFVDDVVDEIPVLCNAFADIWIDVDEVQEA